jgi:glucose/arabinose dehydrogenase
MISVRRGSVLFVAVGLMSTVGPSLGSQTPPAPQPQTAAAPAKEKPEVKADPHGHVVKSERHTVKLEVVAKGLETPWGIAFLPDGRMLVTERPGRLRIVEKGQLLPAVEGIPAVWTMQDGGLFDVEVHPNYIQTGWIYLSYADPGPDQTSMTTIVRGKIRNNAWVDQQVLYKAPAELYTPLNVHYGSRFVFDVRKMRRICRSRRAKSTA